MYRKRLARIVLNELEYLHHNGFRTWVTDELRLSQTYGVENFDMDCNSFKKHCKELVRRKFFESWKCDLNDLYKEPILRMYKLIKADFSMEPYLNLIKEAKYRRSLTKLRLSSHNLGIERGMHTEPVTPAVERLCIVCGVVDDELYFVTSCKNIQQGEKDCIHISILMCQISAT